VLLEEAPPGRQELRAGDVLGQPQQAEELLGLLREGLLRTRRARRGPPRAWPRLRPALRDVEPPAEVADHLRVGGILAPRGREPLAVEAAEEALEAEREIGRHPALVAREREQQRIGLALVEGAVQRPADVDGLAQPGSKALQERASGRCE